VYLKIYYNINMDYFVQIISIIVEKTSQIINNLGSIDFSNLGIGFLASFVLLTILFIIGINIGRTKSIMLLISVYISILLFSLFPYFNLLKSGGLNLEPVSLNLLVFFVILLLVFSFISRSPLRIMVTVAERSEGSWLQIFSLSVVTTGILLSFLVTILPDNYLSRFSGSIFQLFNSQNSLFWWLSLGLVLLAILKRR